MAGPGLKIADGLFLGDRDASTDLRSAYDVQVSHVVNCCGQLLFNRWEQVGIKYLSYKFGDGVGTILDDADKTSQEIFNFVEEGLAEGGSVLIHSYNGRSRSCCIMASYLMRKYCWSRKKAIEYLIFRGVDVDVKPSFEKQLVSFEKRLASKVGLLGDDWQPLSATSESLDLILRNTYINGQSRDPDEDLTKGSALPIQQSLRWADDGSGEKLRLECQDPELDLKDYDREADKAKAPAKSALKALQSSAKSIEIKTKKGMVQCRADEIVPKRLGLKLKRKTIVLEYLVPSLDLTAFHSVLVDLQDKCDASIAKSLQKRHAPWLAGVSESQLEGLISRIAASN
mmetsp:Transcript_28363/g.51204  ORF Transcript_28363/g.51204 Transcript_28363/m.51204 type:complete len:342 (-) Transcript_28363:114-1139(-)